jgi:hypothetical protein
MSVSMTAISLAFSLASTSLPAKAEMLSPDPKAAAELAVREAAVPENPLKDAYFGETHLHTSFSLDAYIGGGRLTPFDAYRFAKGEDVPLNNKIHNIKKPLDFAAVTDHAEFIGEMYSTQIETAPGHRQESLGQLRGLTNIEEQRKWFVEYVVKNNRSNEPTHPPFYAGPETTKTAWKEFTIKAANQHYEPGKFTTLIGYEWTSAPNGGNMHRNVLFRDQVVPDMPFSALDSQDEEKLWAWMAEQEAKGSTLLAIPHNSNGSKGFMFEPVDNAGKPIDAAYAKERSKREPLIEMMQIKGNSEVVASLWPADEFADFENAVSLSTFSDRTFKKENFVRWAVTKGLAYQRELGANPYKLGFIGGTDNHNSAPGDVVESNYDGSHGGADKLVEDRRTGEIDGWLKAAESNPGSLAGVWATKNTRGEIYDAMASRETFVTSGTRIKPRFFAGASLKPTTDPVELVKQGYADGVPMGGTLTGIKGKPSFTVHALKDPDGANLDRIQIIKGWVDAAGEPQEKIIDAVWSGERKKDKNGKVEPVGNTVDLTKATYTNTIGAGELTGHWTDDEFDPAQPALYYVRVIEIPTPRWTTYDAVKNDLPLLGNVPATIQERAWTSPIWYLPEG